MTLPELAAELGRLCVRSSDKALVEFVSENATEILAALEQAANPMTQTKNQLMFEIDTQRRELHRLRHIEVERGRLQAELEQERAKVRDLKDELSELRRSFAE